MKQFFTCAMRQRHTFAIIFFLLVTNHFFTGCRKGVSDRSENQEEFQSKSNQSGNIGGIGNYKGLDPQTEWELQQAKIATARYNNFDQAIADNYVDINVIVPEMGYHYLKLENLNTTFEYDKPEILVYNKEENGRMKLVAVEYAVPYVTGSTPPSGYTGTDDVWSVYQGSLWTLHAWIWEYNPNGVFNPTNPNVHVH